MCWGGEPQAQHHQCAMFGVWFGWAIPLPMPNTNTQCIIPSSVASKDVLWQTETQTQTHPPTHTHTRAIFFTIPINLRNVGPNPLQAA